MKGELERKVASDDGNIKALFEAIRQLMAPPDPKKEVSVLFVRRLPRTEPVGVRIDFRFPTFKFWLEWPADNLRLSAVKCTRRKEQ